MTNNSGNLDNASLRADIKQLIVSKLHLEGMTPADIADDAPLFGEGLGLDSVDALELVVALEKHFGVKIQSHEVDRSLFSSVAALAEFVSRMISPTVRVQ